MPTACATICPETCGCRASCSVRKQPLRAGIVLYGFAFDFPERGGHRRAGHRHRRTQRWSRDALLGVLLAAALKNRPRPGAAGPRRAAPFCGAAAVLGAEPVVVKAAPHKTAVAVSTVVIFGTVSMFYPALWRAGIRPDARTDGPLHGCDAARGGPRRRGGERHGRRNDGAVIVKMIRVMMLAPVLLVMSLLLARRTRRAVRAARRSRSRGSRSGPWPSSDSIRSTCCPKRRWRESIRSTPSC